MTKRVKEHLKKYNKSIGDGTGDEALIQTLMETEKVWTGNYVPSKYWFYCDAVVNIDCMFIMFDAIETPYGLEVGTDGWEFDRDSIREVELVESYQPVRK